MTSDSKIEIIKQWINNGKTITVTPRLNGKTHGLLRWWYKDGTLQQEYSYVNGSPHGTGRYWNENGNITIESEYKNGLFHGLDKMWDFKTGIRRWIFTYKKSQRMGVVIGFK